jgi:hypothetical protein
MKSYTTLRNLFASLTNNNSSENLTLGDQLINDSTRTILAYANWHFLQDTYTASTTASTQYYNLPNDCDKVLDVTVTIGTNRYSPQECASYATWNELNATTSVTSDTPSWYFITENKIGFYPIPASTTSNAITVVYRLRVSDLSVADYTTGNVSALTSGAAAVTGASTSWTAPMGGRWIKISSTSTAGQSGDNMWYKISSVSSTTALTLTRNYQGTTITGNTAYTIGEMSLLPEAYQDLPVYRACYIYFSSVQPETPRANLFKTMYDEGFARLVKDQNNRSLSPVITSGGEPSQVDPNLYPSSVG